MGYLDGADNLNYFFGFFRSQADCSPSGVTISGRATSLLIPWRKLDQNVNQCTLPVSTKPMDEPQLSQDECRAMWWIYIPQQALTMVDKASRSQGSRTGLDPTGEKGGACLWLWLLKGRWGWMERGNPPASDDALSLCKVNHFLFNHKGIIFPS